MIQDTFQSLLDRIKNEVNHMNEFSPLIYKAPHTLRDLSPTSFSPRLVSIGPLHREDDNLKSFETQKIICVNNLIRRTGSPYEDTLKSCLEKAYSSMARIKAYYVWEKSYDDAEVAKMMVVDACFILEFVYLYLASDKSSLGSRSLPKNIIFDLVLLENQIPLFFLDEIYQLTILKKSPNVSLIQFIRPVLSDLSLFTKDIEIKNISINTTPHILSLLHECYKPPDFIKSAYLSATIPSAVDLDRAGVKFKPDQNPKWPMGMNVKSYRFSFFSCFWRKTTLRMPVLVIHDFTELVLRNLIAYEESRQTRNHVTSYASAMDILVDTKEDVAKLVDSKVLVNDMGTNEEAANMINNICKQVTGEDFFYCEEWKILDEYCRGYWPKKITWLRRTYFNSPWNIIVLSAGIIVFVLTTLQTIFTIKSTGN